MGGRVVLLQSFLSGVDETLSKLRKCGLRANVTAKRDLPFSETIALVIARS